MAFEWLRKQRKDDGGEELARYCAAGLIPVVEGIIVWPCPRNRFQNS